MDTFAPAAEPLEPALPPTAGAASLSDGARNDLVVENLALVGYQVSQMITRVPAHIRREDLASAGAMALVQASRAFAPERGVPFARYATIRIRGALVDELRAMDWMSRGGRQKARRIDELGAQMAAQLGRVPEDEEIAQVMGLDAADVREVRAAAAVRTVSLDADPLEAERLEVEGLLPEEGVLFREQLKVLRVAVDELPERLRRVVVGLFYEDATPAELSAELGVSQSRISQLRSQALEMLRGAMDTVLESDVPTGEPAERPGVAERRRLAYYRAVADRAAVPGLEIVAMMGQDVAELA